MRTTVPVVAYVFGLASALVAAFTGSIGPEGPRTAIGKMLMVVYRPCFELFAVPLGGIGLLMAILLCGAPFMLLAWWLCRLWK
jgi:hypothetical protein